MIKLYVFFVLIVVVTISCSINVQEEKKSPPNIIFLMDDQHRWDALGVENQQVITPTLDKLAKEGIRFTQAVCQAPMCIASRNSMMLGLYPNQIGILRNEPGLPDDKLPAKPLPQVFAEAGYETAGFGKTHWGLDCSTRGFQTRFIGECFEEGAVMMKAVDPDKKQRYDDEIKPYGPGEEDPSGYIGRTSGIPEGEHRDGWVFEKCVDYIKGRDDKRPLFLYLSFLKPHAGHNVPAGFEDKYQLEKIDYAVQPPWNTDNSPHAEGINRREKYVGFWKDATEQQWREMTMRYYANCTWIDNMYERTLEALDEKGLLENALIIYVSDHGEMLGEHYYRFNKYCLYEASVRVPMIISGTALPKALKGKKDVRSAELVDVYPTLLKAAGIEIPDKAAGINLLDATASRSGNFCALHERKDEASFMWRTEKYKLILCFPLKEDAGKYTVSDIIGGEFYDLKNEPNEWNNLYEDDSIQKIKDEMTGQLLMHLKTLAPMPPYKTSKL